MATLKLKEKLNRTPTNKRVVTGLKPASTIRITQTKSAKPKKPVPKQPQQKKRKLKPPSAPKKPKEPANQPPVAKRVEVLLKQLEKEHPELFPPQGQPIIKVWVIGMRQEVKAAYGLSNAVARKAMGVWYRARVDEYKAILAKGGMRYHLDGTEAGVISEDHRQQTGSE